MGNTPQPHTLTLYHGSKDGLHGPIQPISRDLCDFGRGFYMGTDRMQPLTLVCSYPAPILYTVELDTDGLNTLRLDAGLDWAMLIAYNRGRLETAKQTALYEHYRHMADGMDLIVGPIANDRMFVVLDRFFEGSITDAALTACMAALGLGDQYVAVTQRACDHVRIIREHPLDGPERRRLVEVSLTNRRKGVSQADGICRQHRRDGRFFDEILNDWAQS